MFWLSKDIYALKLEILVILWVYCKFYRVELIKVQDFKNIQLSPMDKL